MRIINNPVGVDATDALPPREYQGPVTSFYRLGELTAEMCQQELLQALRDKRCAQKTVDILERQVAPGSGYSTMWAELLQALADVRTAGRRAEMWERKLRETSL